MRYFVIAVCSLLLALSFVSDVKAGDTYSNPIYEENFAILWQGRSTTIGIGDPTVISHKNTFYMYVTGDNQRYNAHVSLDLVNWQKGPVVFETNENGLWAPDVFYDLYEKKFYLYYTVNGRIGVAVADTPDGSFQDKGVLVSGAIDAHMYLDKDGRYYLYYATYPSLHIYVQEMTGPTVLKKTPPIKLLEPSEPWETENIRVTEAPWMLMHEGRYYLLYSGGGSNSMDYAMGYATADNPLGPFEKYPGNPIMKKDKGVFGPGHGSVIRDSAQQMWLVYHQKFSDKRDWMRFIALDPLWFDETGVLHGRTSRGSRHPAPSVSIVKE